MKQIKLRLFFVMAFAILLVGCVKIPSQGNNSSRPTETSTSKEETSPSEAERVIVDVDYMTDELLSKYASVTEFVDTEDGNAQKIIFTTNIVVKEFNFIDVAFKEEDGNFVFFENEILFSTEEFSPTKPFVVTWIEQGSIPNKGISFIDESGMKRYFHLTMSGEDGSLLLNEF